MAYMDCCLTVNLYGKTLKGNKSITKIQRKTVRYAGITSPKTSREGKYEE